MNTLLIGRWQDVHSGHIKMIQREIQALEAKKANDPAFPKDAHVVLAVRDTVMGTNNPKPAPQRQHILQALFPPPTEVIIIPDVGEVVYGRDVGYGIRQIEVDALTAKLSGSRLRKSKIWWLSGNSGAGKSTLSATMEGVIHLDGDHLRQIWPGLGFSADDRREQCLRTARLARFLAEQGHDVVVSVIAPYRELREEIRTICNPKFVYLEGGQPSSDQYPYEWPLMEDNDNERATD